MSTQTSGFDSFTDEQKAIVKQALTNIERKKGREYAPTSSEIQTEIDLIEAVKNIEFTRVNNNVNGNPRWVCHWLNFIPEKELYTVDSTYQRALNIAKKLGGRKFHNKQYGGGIVFECFNTDELSKRIVNLKNSL